MSLSIKRTYGDYQTPPSFAKKTLDLIEGLGLDPDICFEPTCGRGFFLKAGLDKFPKARGLGVEINSSYAEEAKDLLAGYDCEILNQDIFGFDYDSLGDASGEILVIGNPPWANNSDLSTAGTLNLPQKSNISKLRGIDAMTGASNFDISESIIMSILRALDGKSYGLAMLCKRSVGIKLVQEIWKEGLSCSQVGLFAFDAREVFGVSVEACLFYVRSIPGQEWKGQAFLADLASPNSRLQTMGFRSGKFYLDLKSSSAIDGACQFEWRQGVKHDLAKIMELRLRDGRLVNGLGDFVDIEEDLLYPLIKSSMVRKYGPSYKFEKYVLVTQTHPGQDTSYIKDLYPKTWSYLNKHRDLFRGRGSSVYKTSPDFAMFGIGDYSFKRYKLAVSGFYKDPYFALLESSKPIMLDDTCYFLAFDDYKTARISHVLLSTDICQDFLTSLVDKSSKRPYTKGILKRIDLRKLAKEVSFEEFAKVEEEILSSALISEEDYASYLAYIEEDQSA